jgi:hypothetical protein
MRNRQVSCQQILYDKGSYMDAIYLFAPIFVSLTLIFHIRRFESKKLSWILLIICLLWGFAHLINPFSVMKLPNILYDPNIYSLFRGIMIISYLTISILAILKKNRKIQYGSYVILIIVLIDFCWSYLCGVPTGP